MEHRSVVVSEMIVCPLPKVCARILNHLNGVAIDGATLGLLRPLEIANIQCHSLLIVFWYLAIALSFAGTRDKQCQ